MARAQQAMPGTPQVVAGARTPMAGVRRYCEATPPETTPECQSPLEFRVRLWWISWDAFHGSYERISRHGLNGPWWWPRSVDPRNCSVRCPQRIPKGTDVKREVPLRTADTATLKLGGGPELCESAWPASVDNTVPSRVRHALAQRSIGHECSNRACEVFDVMRPRDQTVCLVRH